MGTTHFSKPTLAVSLKALLTSGGPPAPVVSQVDHEPVIALAAGTGAGGVNVCFSQAFTVSSSAPFTVNLSTGADPLGNPLSLSTLVAVLVENDSTTAGEDFTVGAGANAVLGADRYTCQAGGGVVLVCNPGAGYPVAAGATDTLRIAVAAGTGVTGKLTVFGR